MTTFILFLMGLYMGLLIGISLGSSKIERLYRPLMDMDKKNTDYWFESYMKLLKDYQEMSEMYVKEATKNMFK
jgi:hypothetical protein